MTAANQVQTTAAPVSVEQVDAANIPLYTPVADIVETSDRYLLEIEMPGVREENVNVTVENDILSIHGRMSDAGSSAQKRISTEFEAGDYRRVFKLTDQIDRQGILASYKDGILRLELRKAEDSKPRKIEIKTA